MYSVIAGWVLPRGLSGEALATGDGRLYRCRRWSIRWLAPAALLAVLAFNVSEAAAGPSTR